jgi:hypothetical protein
MVEHDVRTALRPSQARIVHVVVAFGLLVLCFELMGIVAGAAGSRQAIEWFTALCVGTTAGGWLWRRHRARQIDRLVAAVRNKESLYRCSLTRMVLVSWAGIPLGYEVDMYAVDAANMRDHLAFGFWRKRQAELLLSLLRDRMAEGPPPPIELALWRPAGRGSALPRAQARTSDGDTARRRPTSQA